MDASVVSAGQYLYSKESNLLCLAEDIESMEEDCSHQGLIIEGAPDDILVSRDKKSQTSLVCNQKLFLRHVSDLNQRIPKQIMSLDEKFFRHCLELIHISALGTASSSRIISDGSACYATSFVFSGTENVVIRPNRDAILGSLSRSSSVINIIKSSLFRQLGGLDNELSLGRSKLLGVGEPTVSAVTSAPAGLSISLSQKHQRNPVVLEDRSCEYSPEHKRIVSVSSSSSSTSDHSASSSCSSGSTTYFQGMLHCSWNSGCPHYIFSVDDQRAIYTVNLLKVESPDEKGLDYMYTFYSRGIGENEFHEEEPVLVGTMRVSTSFTLCPNSKEIMETAFVLYGGNDVFMGEMQRSHAHDRKNKGLSKIVDIFRPSHSHRQRSSSKFCGMSVIQENSLDPFQHSSTNNPIPLSPNFELAAIIMKKPMPDNLKEPEMGGWGLKFLKKIGNMQKNTLLKASAPCEFPDRNSGNSSTSVEVLVPAGFHGGPRTRKGGPSSLIGRWKGGGRCDCGGWDVGCPLTVLSTGPNKKEDFAPTDYLGKSNALDLFIQGSKQRTPIIRMVSVHDGLYYIHYQPTVSALQSLSIAVAFIHSHSPTLQPKV